MTAVYSYDNADRLLSLSHSHPTEGSIAGFNYTLDAVGNRLSMVDADGTTGYTYDNLNRLTRVTYPGGETVDYTYDSMGNRLSLTRSLTGTTAYTYDMADRLLTAGPMTYSWDANGNMTAKGTTSFAWDALDRLVSLKTGSATTQYSYYGDSVRVRKQTGSIQTIYLQDTAAPLPMVLAEESQGHVNHYVLGNDLILSINTMATPSFYHPDGLGSTRALSNATGQRTDWYSYDVFGAERSHSGTSGQSFTFTGEQVDAESGLVFLLARHYEPGVGRLISQDTFDGYATFNGSLNRYVYGWNNPTNLIDPTGHDVLQTLRDTRDFLFSGSEMAQIARSSFTRDEKAVENVREVADVVGMVPIAGSTWKHNILYATGQEGYRDFAINQSANALALSLGGVGTGMGTVTSKIAGSLSGNLVKNNLLFVTGLRSPGQFTSHLALDTVGSLLPGDASSFLSYSDARKLLFSVGVSVIDLILKPSQVYGQEMGQPTSGPKYHSGGGAGGGGGGAW